MSIAYDIKSDSYLSSDIVGLDENDGIYIKK